MAMWAGAGCIQVRCLVEWAMVGSTEFVGLTTVNQRWRLTQSLEHLHLITGLTHEITSSPGTVIISCPQLSSVNCNRATNSRSSSLTDLPRTLRYVNPSHRCDSSLMTEVNRGHHISDHNTVLDLTITRLDSRSRGQRSRSWYEAGA